MNFNLKVYINNFLKDSYSRESYLKNSKYFKEDILYILKNKLGVIITSEVEEEVSKVCEEVLESFR